jgi:hypothetical protein
VRSSSAFIFGCGIFGGMHFPELRGWCAPPHTAHANHCLYPNSNVEYYFLMVCKGTPYT